MAEPRRSLRRLRELGRRDLAFVARAAVAAAAADVLVHAAPLPVTLGVLTRTPTAGGLPDAARIVRLTDALLRVDVGPWRPNCVVRVLVLSRYLPAAGVPIVARFGVQRGERDLLKGHAWLERGGEPWCEPEDPRPAYRIMFSWPPPEVPVSRRPVAARAFGMSHRASRAVLGRVGSAVELGKAVHAGLWLGALSEGDLVAVDEAAYQGKYAYHTTDEHNLRGLFDWESAAIVGAFPTSGHLLVTSAGGGREVVALRRRGFRVDGFECNPALAAAANALAARLGQPADVVVAPRDTVPPLDGPYDGVVVGWGSLTYVRGRERRLAYLRALRALVPAGAPLLASFYARTRESSRLAVVQKVGNAVGRALGRAALELGDVIDPVFQHYFSEDEVRRELADAGFAVERYAATPFAHVVARAA